MLCNFVSFVQCPPKGRRETKNTTRRSSTTLWCKTKALEKKNKRTAHKSRASEKGTADEVVVVLLLSRELFFALFRAFVVVSFVTFPPTKGVRHLGEKGLHFLAVVREKKKKGFAFVRRTLLILRTL